MKLVKFLEFKRSDLLPIKSFKLKDDLNPKIWDNFELNDEVREQLLQIGQDFYRNTDISADVVDVVLTGSLTNYNWSEKYSDFDLHIVINYPDISENPVLSKQLCDYAKKVWNDQHEIEIKGYEVEVAIQDVDNLRTSISSGRMGGVFSLLKNKWIKRPEKIKFEPDEDLILSKGKSIMNKVDDIEAHVDEDNYSAFEEKITKVWEKIKDMRKSGLEAGGEYSIGNIVFKFLRRNNYISRVMKLKRYAYDKQFK